MEVFEILKQLRPGKEYDHCHVDPDLRPGLRTKTINGWMPAFGQINSAQKLLFNAKVEPGDLFLFFGWFAKYGVYRICVRYIFRYIFVYYMLFIIWYWFDIAVILI